VPWYVGVIFGAVFAAMGTAFWFFTDVLLDWQIRMLQSRSFRLQMRAMGLVFAVVGMIVVLAAVTGKLR
jgi:hypothetical protein